MSDYRGILDYRGIGAESFTVLGSVLLHEWIFHEHRKERHTGVVIVITKFYHQSEEKSPGIIYAS